MLSDDPGDDRPATIPMRRPGDAGGRPDDASRTIDADRPAQDHDPPVDRVGSPFRSINAGPPTDTTTAHRAADHTIAGDPARFAAAVPPTSVGESSLSESSLGESSLGESSLGGSSLGGSSLGGSSMPGPQQIVRLGAVGASAVVSVFAVLCVWIFPAGGLVVSGVGLLTAILGTGSSLRKTAIALTLAHAGLFLQCLFTVTG